MFTLAPGLPYKVMNYLDIRNNCQGHNFHQISCGELKIERATDRKRQKQRERERERERERMMKMLDGCCHLTISPTDTLVESFGHCLLQKLQIFYLHMCCNPHASRSHKFERISYLLTILGHLHSWSQNLNKSILVPINEFEKLSGKLCTVD